MTNEVKNAVNIIKEYLALDKDIEGNEYLDSLRVMVQALESQPSEDCISREEVQDLISRWLSDYLLDETREALETINYKVGDMPSVTPQRPKGKWIDRHYVHTNKTISFKVCSECGYEFSYDAETGISDARYCPNCGSYNGGGEDEVSN